MDNEKLEKKLENEFYFIGIKYTSNHNCNQHYTNYYAISNNPKNFFEKIYESENRSHLNNVTHLFSISISEQEYIKQKNSEIVGNFNFNGYNFNNRDKTKE